jgi:malonate transporter and related proteins
MNIGGLVGALLPVFFVLALGYVAGKRHAFDADQAAGLSKLALSYALASALFVAMIELEKVLLLQQVRLVLALILAHVGLFVVAWFFLRRINLTVVGIGGSLARVSSSVVVLRIAVEGAAEGEVDARVLDIRALALPMFDPVLKEIPGDSRGHDCAGPGDRATRSWDAAAWQPGRCDGARRSDRILPIYGRYRPDHNGTATASPRADGGGRTDSRASGRLERRRYE